MAFGLSSAAVGLIGIGVGAVGAAVTSKAQKKQSKIQAKAITEGGAIDSAARNKAISQVLEIFGPSLVQFNESMQGSIDLVEQGRISIGDLLTQSANNVSEITQQGGQAALNAMLGLPSPETVSTAAPQQSQQPQAGEQQQQVTTALKPSNLPAPQSIQQPVQNQGGISLDATQALATDGGIGSQQQQQSPNYTMGPNGVTLNGGLIPGGTTNQIPVSGAVQNNNLTREQTIAAGGNMGPFRADDPRADFPPGYNPVQESIYQPTQPLEGELLPRDFNLNQQGINMPQGTGAGLLGAVDAVQSGIDLGREDLAKGAIGALDSLGAQTGIARGDIFQGRDFALNKIQQAIQAGRTGVDQGVNAINAGVDQGVNAINAGVDQAATYLNPYMSAGKEALNPLLALSGVRGQEAFDSALINDPAYRLALQESERSLSRNAAVTGGIGSGNVKERFQINAQQQAATDIDRQLSRFRAITDAGQRAASTVGGFATQGGIAAGNLQMQGGISSGNLEVRGGELEASQLSRMGDVGIQSSQQLAQLAQQLGMSEAQVLQSLGGNLSNIDVRGGQQIGSMRENAGINAAQIIQNTSGQQAGIDAGLANQLANLDQDTLNNIVNTMKGTASTNLTSQQQLATILSNLGIGAGSSAQQTAINLGQANAAGVTNPIGNAINTGIGLYASGAFNQSNTNPYQPPQTYDDPGGYSPNTFTPWTPANLGGQ